MTRKYSVLADILGRRPRTAALPSVPAIGDVYIRKPDHGPIEYAQVIGVYEEEARIAHVRFRLFYGYQDKTAELGERTLAADLFGRRFPRMMPTEPSQPETEVGTPA
ncbi:MAG: hypothetical protein ACPGRZ_12230 [Alphaproteobacteria bacterium]